MSTKPNITLKTIAKLGALRAGFVIWDFALPGFGLRRRPSGALQYCLKYRAGSRQRWYTIGKHGAPWTPESARREAKRLLGEIAAGRDPASQRDTDKRAPTVATITELYLKDHVETKRKPTTARHYRDILERFVLPKLGRHEIARVQRADIARLHQSLRDTPYQANRLLAVLSAMFTWAERHGYRPDGTNPARLIERFAEAKRERFLAPNELARLADALGEAERTGSENPYAIAAVRLLVLTGARRGEILRLEWQQVDFEKGWARLPQSKSGPKTIFFSAPALAVLAAIPRIESNPFVICGERRGCHLVNLQKPWHRIRVRADLQELRLHDCRHTFASVAASGGLTLQMIGKLLGHARAETSARYAHLSPDPVRAANEAIGARIVAAMEGRTGEVVSMRQPKG